MIYQLDPLRDSRWEVLVARHPMACPFHTTSWLWALRRSYGYEPIAFTTTEPGQPLRNGVVFCKVKSWLTGSRLVSLPFADHCQPLVDSPADLLEPLHFLASSPQMRGLKYIEMRPLATPDLPLDSQTNFIESASFSLHTIDLRPKLDDIFRSFHKSCIQRKIHRADREGLRVEKGRSEPLLRNLYSLLLLTRRRHQLPPQPMSWFRDLVDCFGENLVIWVAFKDTVPVASILTLSHNKRMVYKYGCSDDRFHNLGAMPLLFWHAIQEGKSIGAEEFDLGRSDLDNAGLSAFKDH
ncbi:MAG: GNAT family N-acetyltransferase, partial [Bryobacteraceae bacterium]